MKTTGIFLAAICIFACLKGNAQNNKLSADTILARTLRVADSDSTREARIVMTSVRNGKIERSYGLFSWKNDRAIMSFYDSVKTRFLESRLIQVADTFWIYNGQRNNVQIVDANFSTPENRMDGMFSTGKNGFQKPVIDTMYGDSVAVITLTPFSSKTNRIAKVVQHIDVRTYRMIEQTMVRFDGTSVTIKFNYDQINKPIAPEVFQFMESQYPEYLDVIDNRKKKD